MTDQPPGKRPDPSPDDPRGRLAALAVHLFTASGAALGFLALLAAVEGRHPAMFGWLALALAVDGVDGSLARKAETRRVVPKISGDTLDLVVDYVTYVLVPAFAIGRSGLVPEGFGTPAALLVCVTSALYFALTTMKTDDWFFRGFPAIWNVAAFYLFLIGPDPWIALGVVIALSALTFAPFAFVHPFRVRRLRPLTLSALGLWAALAVWAIWRDLRPDAFVIYALAGLGLYFMSLGLFRSRGRTGI